MFWLASLLWCCGVEVLGCWGVRRVGWSTWVDGLCIFRQVCTFQVPVCSCLHKRGTQPVIYVSSVLGLDMYKQCRYAERQRERERNTFSLSSNCIDLFLLVLVKPRSRDWARLALLLVPPRADSRSCNTLSPCPHVPCLPAWMDIGTSHSCVHAFMHARLCCGGCSKTSLHRCAGSRYLCEDPAAFSVTSRVCATVASTAFKAS